MNVRRPLFPGSMSGAAKLAGAIVLATGFASIVSGCTVELRHNYEGHCGDGYLDIDAGEQCEPSLLSSWENACQEAYGDAATGGACDASTCQLLLSSDDCPTCGDGLVNQAAEDCDGAPEIECPGKGSVTCDAHCKHVLSCDSCGNGIVEPDLGEECDPSAGCDQDDDCEDDETCDIHTHTCIGEIGVSPLIACSSVKSLADSKDFDTKPYVSGAINPSSCTDQCLWVRTSCGFCGDSYLDKTYSDYGPGGGYIPIAAEACDSDNVPASLEESFCQEHCARGSSELTFGCRYRCNDRCTSLLPPEDEPPQPEVRHEMFECCLASGTSCSFNNPVLPCCWAIENPGAGTGCDPDNAEDGSVIGYFCRSL